MNRVKRILHEESTRSTNYMKELKTASEVLGKGIKEIEATNSELHTSAEAALQKQQALEASFVRILQVGIVNLLNRRNSNKLLIYHPFRKRGR